MLHLIYIVAPIFLMILLGKYLHSRILNSDNVWTGINTLTYWVLFPALLFSKTSTINFEGYTIGTFSLALIGGYTISVIVSFVGGKMVASNAASLTSILQGGGRHNSFLALAVMSQAMGEEGEAIGVLTIAIMITLSNIVTIIMMTSILSEGVRSTKVIFSEIVRNPFIVAIAIGLAFNYFGLADMPIISSLTAELGKAALPIALLCVGAGLQFVNVREFLWPTAVATLAKMIIYPIAVYFFAQYLELSPFLTAAAVVFAAVPTSSTAYALAKYMGGDAPLMAAILTLQTMLSIIVFPVVIILVS